MSDYIAGGPIDLYVKALPDEEIRIGMVDTRSYTDLDERGKDLGRIFFDLSKDEKFILLSELQNNVAVNHNITGHWFLSPVADHALKTQIARSKRKQYMYRVVLWLLGYITA